MHGSGTLVQYPADVTGESLDRIVVRSSPPLEGTVTLPGAKNSALKLMAATLLAEGSYRLKGVPRIVDVALMGDLLRVMGCQVCWDPADPSVLCIDVPAQIEPVAPYEIVERFRASVVVLGPMLARCGEASVALPGGDDFGPRPIDIHLHGLMSLGATVDMVHGNVEARAEMLLGSRLTLEYPSVGATENLLMAAVAAKGETVIDNAAREPEIVDLCQFLTQMGASIVGAGTSTIVIQSDGSTDSLQSTDHTVVADRIVAATYFAALGVCRGEIVIEGARSDHMNLLFRTLRRMGVTITPINGGVRAIVTGRLECVDCSTLPYPGVSTDYKPFLVVLLASAAGVGIVTENVFAGRFRYVDELRRMGADIRTVGHHAVVHGVDRLSGAPVRAHDIRAGAALVVAGLGAKGTTTVSATNHIDRGYEDLAGKLASLGADVYRC